MAEPASPLAEGLPMMPPECEHHYVSIHEPGHRLYWVRQCSLCHGVDWADLDAEVAEYAAAMVEQAARTPDRQRGKAS